MTITTIDRDALRRINMDIQAALAAVATRHGLVITLGKSHYGGPTGDTTVKFAVSDSSGAAALSSNTTDMMTLTGLTKEACLWPSHPGRWSIVDYNGRAHRMPWIIQREGDMKRFKVPTSTARAIFGKTARIPASPPVITPSIPVNTRPAFSQPDFSDADIQDTVDRQLRQEAQAAQDALKKVPTSHSLYDDPDF